MIEGTLFFIVITFFSTTIVLGVKWRKEPNNLIKEIIKSKQNICMGIMLLFIAMLFFVNIDTLWFKLIISFIILAVGLFNTYQGVRMYQHYHKQLEPSSKN